MPFALDPVSELPSSVDWRETGVVSPVKNQGACGSCWAFATIEGLESHLALQTGILFSLSMQQLVSCSPNPHHCGGLGGCLGSIPQLGYDHVAQHGIVEEWSFSYDSFHGQPVDCPYDQPLLQMDDASSSSSSSLASTTRKSLYAGAVATIEGYATTPVNNYTAVMNAVAKHGPIVVSVAASHWGLYQGGVFDSHHKDASAYDMNHAVLLVGYGTDDETGQDYWLVRNSWGPQWGTFYLHLFCCCCCWYSFLSFWLLGLLCCTKQNNTVLNVKLLGCLCERLLLSSPCLFVVSLSLVCVCVCVCVIGEKGYIRLKRQDPATMDDPESDCGMDVTPSDGDACSRDDNGNPIDPPDMKVCGTSGVYYMGVFPVGGSLAD